MANSKGELSRRVGGILGAHVVLPDERESVVNAIEDEEVETWDDLPADVRDLLEEIETRPGPGI